MERKTQQMETLFRTRPFTSREQSTYSEPVIRRERKCPRLESNQQPSASEADAIGFEVITRPEVTTNDSAVCTSVCTNEPQNQRKPGSETASVGPVEQAEVKPIDSDFAAALKMLATLPLSDEERTEGVRRLLRGI